MSKQLKNHSKGKFFFGSVKVGERGQIVIPSEARKLFNINPGDQLLVFGDKKKGIGLIKATILKKFASQLFQIFEMEKEKESKENDDKNEEI